MDDHTLRLALEPLLDEPTLKSAHRASVERGLTDLRAQRLSPDERADLYSLIEHYAATAPSADPMAALVAAFQDKLPSVDPVALSTAIHALVAGDTAQLDGKPLTLTIERRGQIQIANLAEHNVVIGDLNQFDISVQIPIPDARFDALLATALKTHEHQKTLARIQHAAQQIESDRLLNLRLQGFVGRVAELAAIREHIEAMRPTGGYVLIKAAAGEGKSSSIAKLIQEAGIAQTPHHFIALTTGREYQLGLLRAVVAQLILKHNLTVSYFPEESYPAMQAEFARILHELSKQGIPETIYLDGIDQLQPEIDGTRDLSFLPPQPPSGIVIVLGSRPDETLKPLEILHRVDYDLPPLSEDDALQLWRSVQPDLADSLLYDLYVALKGNALFVHLATDTMRNQSVVDATSLIQQIEKNPQNIFSITLDRIRGRSRAQWDMGWKPMLALLLVAQEPLRLDVVGDLLGHDHDTMLDAVRVLGGLVSQGIDQRVALHHLLFHDYLAASIFNQREVKVWHQRLADWCAHDLDSIWADHADAIEQVRRIYARHHYITHLFLAENWTALWQVLDAGDYGEYKTDLSTRLYALDLDRGRESTIIAGKSVDEHIQNLPRLWKYSLLRTRLSSSINQWPPHLFEMLARLGRIQEALERIELCTRPDTQLQFWQCILPWCNEQQQSTVITRIQQVLPFTSSLAQVKILTAIAAKASTTNSHQDRSSFIQQAINIIPSITSERDYVQALLAISDTGIVINDHPEIISLIHHAMIIIPAMETSYVQHEGWIALSKVFGLIGDSHSANALIEKAITCVLSSETELNFPGIFIYIAFPNIIRAFIDNGNLERAYAIAYDINANYKCAWALADIAQMTTDRILLLRLIDEIYTINLSRESKWNQTKILARIIQITVNLGNIADASMLFDQVYNAVQTIPSYDRDVDGLIFLTHLALTLNSHDRVISLLQLAITTAYSTDNDQTCANNLTTIAQTALSLGYHEQASNLISQAITNIQQQDDNRYRINALSFMMHIITNAQDSDNIKDIIDQSTAIIQTIPSEKLKIISLEMLAIASAQAGFFNSALAVAAILDNPDRYEHVVATVAHTQANTGLLTQALTLTKSITHQYYRLDTLKKIAKIAAKQGLLQSMTEHALSQESSKTRTEFLYAIIDAAATMGNIDYALNLTKLIQQDNQHPNVLTTIVRRILLSGNLEYATSIASSIRPVTRQTSAFVAIATAAIKMGDLNYAVTIVQDIPDVWHRIAMLLEIVQAANKNGKHLLVEACLDRVKNIVYLLPTGQKQDTIWSALVSQYSALNNLETATLIAKTIVNQEIRASSFMALAQIYHAREESSSMIHMLNEAMQSVYEIPNPQQSIDILLQLLSIHKVMQICHDKRSILDEIFKRTTRIENQEHRIDALIKITIQIKIAAIETDHSAILHDALRLAQSIDMPEHRIESLIKIAIAMATIGNFEQSIAIVQSLEEESQPNALRRIAIALTKIGEIDQALIFTQFILDDFIRVDTWTRMVAVTTENKNHQKAREVLYSTIEQVSLMNTTDDVLSRLANSAALLGQLDQAFAIAQSISDTAQRSEILATLIRNYDPTPERTLSIIQSVWYQVKHDSRLWDFLPLATPLLDQYPWLGIAILETEKWVKQQQVWVV